MRCANATQSLPPALDRGVAASPFGPPPRRIGNGVEVEGTDIDAGVTRIGHSPTLAGSLGRMGFLDRLFGKNVPAPQAAPPRPTLPSRSSDGQLRMPSSPASATSMRSCSRCRTSTSSTMPQRPRPWCARSGPSAAAWRRGGRPSRRATACARRSRSSRRVVSSPAPTSPAAIRAEPLRSTTSARPRRTTRRVHRSSASGPTPSSTSRTPSDSPRSPRTCSSLSAPSRPCAISTPGFSRRPTSVTRPRAARSGDRPMPASGGSSPTLSPRPACRSSGTAIPPTAS